MIGVEYELECEPKADKSYLILTGVPSQYQLQQVIKTIYEKGNSASSLTCVSLRNDNFCTPLHVTLPANYRGA